MAITNPGITSGQLASHEPAARLPQSEAAKADTLSAPLPCADDITQQGLQEAQRSLTNDADVDAEKISRMQTLLADSSFAVDTDELASSMLQFFNTRGRSEQ